MGILGLKFLFTEWRIGIGDKKLNRYTARPIPDPFGTAMTLNGKQRHYLRSLAHHRKPAVTIGDAGLTEAVMQEIEVALGHHELLKIKVRAERDERHDMVARICDQTGAEPVQEIGQMAVIYRPAPQPHIRLP